MKRKVQLELLLILQSRDVLYTDILLHFCCLNGLRCLLGLQLDRASKIQTPQRNTTQIDFAFTNKSTDRLKIDKLHSEMQLCDQGLRDSILYTKILITTLLPGQMLTNDELFLLLTVTSIYIFNSPNLQYRTKMQTKKKILNLKIKQQAQVQSRVHT